MDEEYNHESDESEKSTHLTPDLKVFLVITT